MSEPRKILRVELWPAPDRAAWDVALAEGDIFDGRGPAAHWSQGTRRNVASGYGRWIGFLTQHMPEVLAEAPADRITPERIKTYVEALGVIVTASGLHNYVKHLYGAIRAMAPERDWSWLGDVVRRLGRKVRPRSKRHRMVAADRLFDLGIHLMETAHHLPASPRLARAIQFRDGLIIALLAARPIRRGNLAGIRVGRNLIKVGETWLLQFCEAETKNRQPLEFPVPDRLVPYLERYLSDIRPSFTCAEEHDGLWASAMGPPDDRVCHL